MIQAFIIKIIFIYKTNNITLYQKYNNKEIYQSLINIYIKQIRFMFIYLLIYKAKAIICISFTIFIFVINYI